jgi:hypothetical protein
MICSHLHLYVEFPAKTYANISRDPRNTRASKEPIKLEIPAHGTQGIAEQIGKA